MGKSKKFKPKKQYTPQGKKKLFSPGALVAIFIGFVMVSSTLGFIASYTTGGGTGAKVPYGEYTFTQTQRGYALVLDDVELEFSYFPESLTHIQISDDIVSTLKNSKQVIVTYDPSSSINGSAGLIQYNLEQVYDKVFDSFASRALINNTAYPQIPQADCSDATEFVPVLVWELGNESRMIKDGNCIHAQALSDFDAIRLHDKLLYLMIGVMQE